MEVAIAIGSLKAAYHLVVFGIKLDQVPAAVRRCLELVRACHYDLQDLIKLRNESLSLLETKHAILERVNTIIENAHKGLLEVCQLVEKLRPAAHDGNTPLMSRIEWLFFDSSEFTSQEPLIAAQHRSVIAELGFLRQLVLFTPMLSDLADKGKAKAAASDEKAGEKSRAAQWDNLALLDEMLGGGKKDSAVSSQVSIQPQCPVNVNLVQVQMSSNVGTASPPVPTEPPPPYSPPRENGTLASAFQPLSNQAPQRSSGSTFDTEGVSLLFGNLKVSDGQQFPSPPPAQPTQQDFYTSFIQTENTGSNGQQSIWNSKPSSHLSSPPPAKPQFFLGGNTDIKQAPAPQSTSPYQQPWGSHGTLSPPQQLHHRQSMPVISPQNQPAAQPLSTIPQELIHRYDGLAYSPPTKSAAPFVPSQAAAWNKLQQEKSHQRSGSLGQGSASGQKIYLQGNSGSSLNLSTQTQQPPLSEASPAQSKLYLSNSHLQTATETDSRRASTPNPYSFQSHQTSRPPPSPHPQKPVYLGGNTSNQQSPYNQHTHPSQSVSHLPSAHTFPVSAQPSHLPAHATHDYPYLAQSQRSSTPNLNYFNSPPQQKAYPYQQSTHPTPETQYIHPQSTGGTNYQVSSQITGSAYQVSAQSTGASQFYTPSSSSQEGFGTPAAPSASGAGLGVSQPRELRSKRSTIDTYFMDQSQLPAGIGYFGPGAGVSGGHGKAQEVRTEVYELPSFKFAPDPVEMP